MKVTDLFSTFIKKIMYIFFLGSLYLWQFLLQEKLFEEVNENFDLKGTHLILGLQEDEITDEDSATANLIKMEYLDGLHTNFTKDNWQRIAKMLGDVIYLVPIDIEARSLAENSDRPVFYYRNKYVTSFIVSGIFSLLAILFLRQLTGKLATAYILFVFFSYC